MPILSNTERIRPSGVAEFISQVFHYGRRVAIPSTVRIRHELGGAADGDIRVRCAAEDGLSGTASWDAIATHRAARVRRTNTLRNAALNIIGTNFRS